jgi:SMODS-associated and fused to various effectors sensor domain
MPFSASAARLQGDNYQHLFTWYQALLLLDPNAEVTAIEIEAENAGNVDDLIVRRQAAPNEYYQVKYSVDASRPLDNAWWLTPSTAKGTSPLQKFWQSYQLLKAAGRSPHLVLFTNRVLDVTDPLLKLRDGQYGRLMPRAAKGTPGSKAGKRRQEWSAHIGASEADLLEMLSNLDLRTDQGAHTLLATSTADRMAAHQLRHDEDAVARGAETARAWVTNGVRRVDRSALVAEIERKRLRGDMRRATLVVEGIDRTPLAESATASVNWVELFKGDEPKLRRQLRDPSLWNTRIREDIRGAEARIRQMGFDRVLVRGFMRLPTSFAVGAQFADSRGYHLSCIQRSDIWTSDIAPTECEILVERQAMDLGPDLALALSVTNDLSRDVISHIRSTGLPIGRFVHVATAPEPNPESLPSGAKAKGWALKVRDIVRDAVREAPVPKLHLFLSGPAGAALLLGHFWNRVPYTQLYEDLNPDYAPTLAIPS